jgi:Zn-dependent protease
LFTRMELGRIAGIPIYLDMLFVLVVAVFGWRYFTSGDMQLVSLGLVIVAGVLVSILLHELGHAFAGRLFGVRTREIELTGLGGVARFANALPRSAFARSLIYLAGPAVNLVLWLGLEQLGIEAAGSSKPLLVRALLTLSLINYWLLIFNLLPAFPLDGGFTLDAWLGKILGPNRSAQVVAVLGLIVCAGIVYLAFPTNFWMLLLAFVLFQANWSVFDAARGGRR